MADYVQIGSVGAFAFIMLIIFAFGLYGFIQWYTKKKFEIAYVDKYKQLIQVTKMNCPNEIYEKELIKASDKNFSGIVLGYIYGKNFIEINKKWYHLFVICKKKKSLYTCFSSQTFHR